MALSTLHGVREPWWREGNGQGGLHSDNWLSLRRIDEKNRFLADMQRAAEEAAEALGEVCMVLDEVALDMSFARHANRMPLRQASQRIAQHRPDPDR